jgi:hypothetical protein
MPEANPTTFEFLYSYNASGVVGNFVFQSRMKYFCFQNRLPVAVHLAIVGLAPGVNSVKDVSYAGDRFYFAF